MLRIESGYKTSDEFEQFVEPNVKEMFLAEANEHVVANAVKEVMKVVPLNHQEREHGTTEHYLVLRVVTEQDLEDVRAKIKEFQEAGSMAYEAARYFHEFFHNFRI